MKPTKKFLLDQIKSCEEIILQNRGAIALCQAMINNNCFVEEETQEKKEPELEVKS